MAKKSVNPAASPSRPLSKLEADTSEAGPGPAAESLASTPPRRGWTAPRASSWERREGLRATLLLHLPTLRERATLRRLGQILYDASLSRAEEGIEEPHHFAFRQMEAALSELRFLQGFLFDVAEMHLGDDEPALHRIGRQARALARILERLADAQERRLAAEAARLEGI